MFQEVNTNPINTSSHCNNCVEKYLIVAVFVDKRAANYSLSS